MCYSCASDYEEVGVCADFIYKDFDVFNVFIGQVKTKKEFGLLHFLERVGYGVNEYEWCDEDRSENNR